ncbi:MAG: glycosyltransferase family 1 protein [Magnetococcales bacterium]|nr:glycosyltransferase family 1 protein [Magnetococcales bacterium]
MESLDDLFRRLESLKDDRLLVETTEQYLADPGQLVSALFPLLLSHNYKAAYLIAKTLLAHQIEAYPMIHFARAFGGMIVGNIEDEIQGSQEFARCMDMIAPEHQATYYQSILDPLFLPLIGNCFHLGHKGMVMRLLEFLKAGSPLLRSIFDFSLPILPLNQNELRRRGWEKAKLLNYPQPPPGPRPVRRAVVAIRELIFPHLPQSRLLDLGPRTAAAMNAYGWQTHFHPVVDYLNMEREYRALLEICRQQKTELLVLDDMQSEDSLTLHERSTFIAQLRQELPDLKIAVVFFDTWMVTPQFLIDTATIADVILEVTSPSLPVWQHPACRNKVLHVQLPHAHAFPPPTTPLRQRPLFLGSVMKYNYHRALWLSAIEHFQLPIDSSQSSHEGDGKSALESYGLYLQRLRETTCSLNLTMRMDLSRIVTGRCFETLLTGSLLIQEHTPDMDYYFVAGEHYLEFHNVAELASITNFILQQPQEAEEIRRRGYEFARDNYSDDKLVGIIDKFLFYP